MSVKFTNRLKYIVSGFSATPADDEDNYLWFPLPQASTYYTIILSNVVTCERGIQLKVNKDSLTLNLMDPAHQWVSQQNSANTMQDNEELRRKNSLGFCQVPNVFSAFQKYRTEVRTKIHSGTRQLEIRIIDKQNERRTGLYMYQLPCSFGHNKNCTCAMVKDDLYIIIEDKMVAIQNLDQKIIQCKDDNNLSPDFEIAVPHSDSTPFVVQDILFIVGGHDSHFEPFPDIYQFDHDTMSWLMYGRATVSRYGAKVVVFNGRNEKESFFIVGGFKQNNDPCSVIERIPVEVS